MKVKNLVSFSKENFFNGAVQTEWFYDTAKAKAIAESYVFHGPEYYGVSSSDVQSGSHKLMDTASFAKTITDKLYAIKPNNTFVMTIAGYGTGKSHLAVCLSGLFSQEPSAATTIIDNISSVDKRIGEYIREKHTKRNFVVVLNGMNNFNLDAEVLRCARCSLARYGISDDLFKQLTKSYDVAKHFVERNFLAYQESFEFKANQNGIFLTGLSLKNYLIEQTENESKVLSIINEVYTEANGDSIAWDRGLSAGSVLDVIQRELCGEDKPFNKVLFLFDELGRYIEYTAANPAIAGEAALQQIFEATQTADGKVIFVGFIQSELEAYLARIEKTSNITRYLERYRAASENLFLSSNFETILASVLKKNDPDYSRVISGANHRYDKIHMNIQNALLRWDRTAVKKSVWETEELYKNVILNGCYPLHPITVWLLSSFHQWMQQRSTLAFVSEMYDAISETNIDGAWLPYIYPVEIIDSGIFAEMLNSEEKGLIPSQHCMLYRDIKVKFWHKLSEQEQLLMKAILVVNIGRMSFYDKAEAMLALGRCSHLKEEEVEAAFKSLEDMHGVISFDDNAKTIDLVAEANGFNEFKRALKRYHMGISASISDLDEEIISACKLNAPIETAFSENQHISSREWHFKSVVLESGEINEAYLQKLLEGLSKNYNGENARGLLIYIYCNKDAAKEAERLAQLHEKMNLKMHPILFLFWDDNENEVIKALKIKRALLKFSVADRERFEKHISGQQRVQNKNISVNFMRSMAQRFMITGNGINKYELRQNALCTKCFADLYTKAVPFQFDGFENKSSAQARATLVKICHCLYNRSLMNVQVYNSLIPKDKNRVGAVLGMKTLHSWKVFAEDCKLVIPENMLVRNIIEEVVESLEDGETHMVDALFMKYAGVPYGMNENSIALLVSYFMAYEGNRYHYYCGSERLIDAHWVDARGKEKLPELQKLKMRKNENVHYDVIAETCKKILENQSVECCADFKETLDALIAQEGESDSNKFLIVQAKEYLAEGVLLAKGAENRYQKFRTQVEKLKQGYTMAGFINALQAMPLCTGGVKTGLSYHYTDSYANKVNAVKACLEKMLDTYCSRAIHAEKCKLTGLDLFKQRGKNLVIVLRKYNYNDYAEVVEKQVQKVSDELLARQKYESQFVECDMDIVHSSNAKTYHESEMFRLKLMSWLKFLDSNKDVPADTAAQFFEKLNVAIAQMESKQAQIVQEYESLVTVLNDANDVVALKQAEIKLNNLQALQLPEQYQCSMVGIRAAIDAALLAIQYLPQNIDELEEEIREPASEENKYCGRAIKGSAKHLKAKLEKEQLDWQRTHLVGIEEKCTDMSPAACQQWLEKTKYVPSSFSSRVAEKISCARVLVEKQLHKSRVEALIAAYKVLTDDEKEAFRKLIW